MKNTVLMLSLLTATAGAMAATSYRETISPNAPKHVDSTQSNIGSNAQHEEPQTVLQQIMQRRSSH